MDTDRRKMSVGDWLKITIPAITLAMAGVGGYYDLKADMLLAKQEIDQARQKIDQETKGYFVVQEAINNRLARLEDKLDRLIERGAGKPQ